MPSKKVHDPVPEAPKVETPSPVPSSTAPTENESICDRCHHPVKYHAGSGCMPQNGGVPCMCREFIYLEGGGMMTTQNYIRR